jgi:acyl dehydratase
MTAPAEELVCPDAEFEVTAQRIEEYAESTGDANPRYRRRGRDTSGMVAPRALAAAYLQLPVRLLMTDRDRMQRAGIAVERIVFGEVEYRYGATVRPGDWVRISGRLLNRRTSGERELFTFAMRAVLDDGREVAAGTITLVRR